MSQTRRPKGFLASPDGLKKLRAKKFEKNYNYEQIKDEAHVSLDQVKRLFNPHWEYKVGEEAIEAIARVLDLQPTDIVDTDEWNPPPAPEATPLDCSEKYSGLPAETQPKEPNILIEQPEMEVVKTMPHNPGGISQKIKGSTLYGGAQAVQGNDNQPTMETHTTALTEEKSIRTEED